MYKRQEQGRIGQILSSRPTDRRAILEEAAGITEEKMCIRDSLPAAIVFVTAYDQYALRAFEAGAVSYTHLDVYKRQA